MRRMITEKELSFFDTYANYGAIGRFSGCTLSVPLIKEYPGIIDAQNYATGTKFIITNATFDFQGANIARANLSFMQTSFDNNNRVLTIKNVNISDAYFMFWKSTIANVKFENVRLTYSISNMFNDSSVEQILGDGDVSATQDAHNCFNGCTHLRKIQLKHWRINFNISASTQFDTAALVEIISNLDDTGSAHTLTMGATNLAKLNEAQKKVATDKGWNLA